MSSPRAAITRSGGHGSGRTLRRVRRWTLALADITAIGVGILIAWEAGKITESALPWSLLIVPVWIVVAKLYNLYDRDDRRIRHRTSEEVPSLLATAAITVVIARGLTELFSVPLISSASMIIIGAVAVAASLALRAFVRGMYRVIAEPETTIIVGSGPKAALVSRRLASEAGNVIDLIGYVASDSDRESEGPSDLGIECFGPVDTLSQITHDREVTRVVIADDGLDSRAISTIINICRSAEAAVTLVPVNQEVLGPTTELNRIAEVPMLDFHFSIPPRSTLALKRALDLSVSGTLLALTSPLLLLSAVAIKLNSSGPVLFRQVRVGKNGEKFTMYKLRTMVADAESKLDDLIDLDALDEPAFKIRNDPRITKVGSFLRRSSMDEIPQFFNVLMGNMSMVGPRPEEEAVVALYDERQRQRLMVKPGLTGPMQVAGRGNLNFEERLALERDYLDNMTIAGDIAILARTPTAVIRGDGAF